MNSISIDELVGSLQSYELDLPKTSKSKSMALKSVDDVDGNGFDDELSATKLLTLPRTLEIFLGTIIEGQEVRTLLNLEILGGMISLRLITLKNLKRK